MERLSNFPKFTELTSGRVSIGTRADYPVSTFIFYFLTASLNITLVTLP